MAEEKNDIMKLGDLINQLDQLPKSAEVNIKYVQAYYTPIDNKWVVQLIPRMYKEGEN